MRHLLCCLLLTTVLGAAERPDEHAIKERQTVRLEAKPDARGLHLRWHPANAAPSDGIKIAFSTEHRQPVYGHGLDPALAWIPGVGHQRHFLPWKHILHHGHGEPMAVRLIFVHREGHGDPRLHVAYSNTVMVEPVHIGRPEGDRLAKRPEHGGEHPRKPHRPEGEHPHRKPHDGEHGWKKPHHEGEHGWKEHDEGEGWAHEQDGWHDKPARPSGPQWPEQPAKSDRPVRERVAKRLAKAKERAAQRRAKAERREREAAKLPPPKELADPALEHDERRLVEELYQLEQRRHDLERQLAALEQAE